MRNVLLGFVFLAAVSAGAPAAGQVAPAEPPAESPAERPDLALFDQPSLAYGVFEVGRHWRGKEGASLDLLCSAHPIILAADPVGLARRAGITPRSVERVLMVMGRGQMIYATTFSEPAALSAMRKTLFPGGTLEAVGDRKILLGGPKGAAGYELTDRILVVGDSPEIRVIAGPPTPATTDPLIRGFRTLLRNEKPLLALQLDAARLGPRLKADFEPHGLAPLIGARAWRLVCATTEKGLLIQLAAQFDEPAQAAAGAEALGNLQKLLVTYLNLAAAQVPAMLRNQAVEYPDGPKIAGSFENALKRISLALGQSVPKVGGSMLSVDFRVETETPAGDVICLLTLIPRAQQ
jgi:hypothetical protein